MKSKTKKSSHIKYFSFLPGIPWKIKSVYVLPETTAFSWNKLISDKQNIIICCQNGGLIESIMSLSILELFNYLYPNKILYWDGNILFKYLIKVNGLAKLSPKVPEEILNKYPVPIFLDKKNRVYINSLFNYIDVYKHYGEYGYHDKSSLLLQLARNSTQPWDNRYIAKLRNISPTNEYKLWEKINKFYSNKPYICLFPDYKTNYSNHKVKCLDWSESQIKAFAVMLYNKGISLLVITKNINKYRGHNIFTLPLKLEYFLHLIPEAKAILSEEIDFLLVGLLLSEAIIISKKLKGEYKLDRNNKFLGDKNKVYMEKEFTPSEIANII